MTALRVAFRAFSGRPERLTMRRHRLRARSCRESGKRDHNRSISGAVGISPGYRVYYKQQGRELVILLAGGDMRTQTKDTMTALRLAGDL